VTDALSMQPVAEAIVEWRDAMADGHTWPGTRTGLNGEYQLAVRKIPTSIEMRVRKSGYSDYSALINVREDMTLNFTLTPATPPR
jgi:hypothetical protein